jgi:hypothetical protein
VTTRIRILLGVAAVLAVAFVGLRLLGGGAGESTVPLDSGAPTATVVTTTTTTAVASIPAAPRDPFVPLVETAPPPTTTTTVAPAPVIGPETPTDPVASAPTPEG